MKYILIIVSVCIFFNSCTPIVETKLENNIEINSIFNKNEVKSLKSIVDYCDKLVIEQTNEDNISLAYYEFFSKDLIGRELIDSLTMFFNYNFNHDFLDEFKSTEVFEEIWTYTYGYTDYKAQDTVSKSLIYNTNGKYYQLMNSIKNNEPSFVDYISSIDKIGGDIPPSEKIYFFLRIDEFDFNQELYRLIIGIHYLTISSKIDKDKW